MYDENHLLTVGHAKQLSNAKVDKVDGKGLSTNDYTNEEKTKLEGIEAQANKTIVDDELDSESENPVQNKVVKAKTDELDASIVSLNQAIDAYTQALNGIGLDIENGTLVIEPVTA